MKMTKDKKELLSISEAMNKFNEFDKERYWINLKLPYTDIRDNRGGIFGKSVIPLVLYLNMRCRIVRKGWIDHPNYPLKKNYYDNGYLVMSMSVREMAKEFGMRTKNVTEFTKILKDNGWIKILPLAIPGKPKPQNVYVFGNWIDVEGKIEEEYFASKF